MVKRVKYYAHPKYPTIVATRSGRVFSVHSGDKFVELSGAIDGSGYVQVYVKDIKRLRQKHRVVWECVTGKMLPKYRRRDPNTITVNHKDGDKQNCAFSNLELLTHLENVAHSVHVIQHHERGAACHAAKLTYEDVVKILGMFKRGLPNNYIAQFFPIDVTNVSRLRTRKKYRPELERYDREHGEYIPIAAVDVRYGLFRKIVRAYYDKNKPLPFIAKKTGLSVSYLKLLVEGDILSHLWQRYESEEL